jgi:hypothetical protein
MMTLNTIPLSIGNLQPAFVQSGGQAVTIRGSGFQAGAAASFGGVQVSTAFVDEDTLTAVVPTLASGWQDITVTNSDGNSYTIPGAFQVLGALPTPSITGFSPAALIADTDDPALPVTILGSGFAAYDTVELNEDATDNALIDDSDMQAEIPSGLTQANRLDTPHCGFSLYRIVKYIVTTNCESGSGYPLYGV